MAHTCIRPPEVASLLEELQCARETLGLKAADAFAAVRAEVASLSAECRGFIDRFAELDVLAAFASAARAHGYVEPRILGEDLPARLRLRQARHPTAEVGLPGGGEFIPNDVHLRQPADGAAADADTPAASGDVHTAEVARGSVDPTQCMLLFGPNAGGKSLYARMALTVAIMAQIGCWVPAADAELTPFSSIHTRIGSSDRILHGTSTFMLELSEASAILNSATSHSLVLMDELGRGTSTHDGTAVAMATLEHILLRLRSLCIFITHFPVLAQVAAAHPAICACHHMAFVEQKGEVLQGDSGTTADPGAATRGRQNRVSMLYNVVPGVLETSFGVNVARLAGLPPTVLETAAKRSAALEHLVQCRRLKSAVRRTALGEGRLFSGESDQDRALLDVLEEQREKACHYLLRGEQL